jgi:hypothetical protein
VRINPGGLPGLGHIRNEGFCRDNGGRLTKVALPVI